LSIDIGRLVEDKVNELAERPALDTWVGLAAVWGRTFALGAAGWARWPDASGEVVRGLAAAFDRIINGSTSPTARALASDLNALDIEDDGSSEWKYMADLIAMLVDALTANDGSSCLGNTLTLHLDGTFNVIATELPGVGGEATSYADALTRVEADPRWARATSFIAAL